MTREETFNMRRAWTHRAFLPLTLDRSRSHVTYSAAYPCDADGCIYHDHNVCMTPPPAYLLASDADAWW